MNVTNVAPDTRGAVVEVHAEAQAHYSMMIEVLGAARKACAERIGIAPNARLGAAHESKRR